MIYRIRFATPCLLLMAVALCGCQGTPSGAPAEGAAIPAPAAPPVSDPQPVPPASGGQTPIKEALTGLLTQTTSSPFPPGTQLIGVSVKEGVATLDFSKEFNALANSGDSVESAAQKSLRSTLAKFPHVQKMRVTVDGKAFDSQNTDWNTPFPVRDGAQKGAGEAQGGGQ